jgi:SagB-type dehydrogenase family enzyme
MLMKKNIFIPVFILLTSLAFTQGGANIQLPEPVRQGGKPLMQALNERHSSREYSNKELTPQQLADLLWAANGINRSDGKRTAPTARNKQEIDIYLTMVKGIFRYNAEKNSLINISTGDIRPKTGSQSFVKDAAVNILYVCNKTKSASSEEKDILVNAAFTAGAIAQNVYLYCASAGLGSVVRGSYDSKELNGLLKLNEDQFIVMAQTVGCIR